jgi:16S rRNA (adenine1518-N6/adenine1519-N6)-dimethyltransferase
VSLLLMFQKEVAQRITARHNTAQYGRLSVLAQHYYSTTCEITQVVKGGSFVPPPRVDAAVVLLTPRKKGEQQGRGDTISFHQLESFL